MTPETAFAELMGKATGGSGGVGGSMHLIDFSKGNIGANAIVGARACRSRSGRPSGSRCRASPTSR